MEALLTSFIAAALAEYGDKTQLLTVALVASCRRPWPVLAGLAAAALTSSLVAAYAGQLIHASIVLRAASLFLALALLYAGVAGLIGNKPPKPVIAGRMPVALVAFICLLASEMGDKTQFLTAALAAQYDSLLLAGFGATAGVLAANIPVLVLGDAFTDRVPLRAIRIGAAMLFLLGGAVVAVNALRLV